MSTRDRTRLKQSLKNLKRLLALEPGHIGHLEQLARVSAGLGKAKDAARYLIRRAEALAKQGAHQAALVDCASALRFEPKNRKAQKLHAQIQEQTHRAAAELSPQITPRRLKQFVFTLPVDEHALAPDEIIYDASDLLAIRDNVGLESITPSPAPIEDPITIARFKSTGNTFENRATIAVTGRALKDDGTMDLEANELIEIEPQNALLLPPRSDTPKEAAPDFSDLHPSSNMAPQDGDPVGLPLLDMFSALPGGSLVSIADDCARREYAPGATVTEAGQAFDGILVVIQGTLAVYGYEDTPLRRIHTADVLGLVEAFRGGLWRNDVVAETHTEVLVITPSHLTKLLQEFSELHRHLTMEAQRRHAHQLVVGCRLFRTLSNDEQVALAKTLKNSRIAEGGFLCSEGEHLGAIYLIASGRLQMLHWGCERATLGTGECVGVLAALNIGTAHASAKAMVPTELYRLDEAELKDLLTRAGVRSAFEQVAQIRRLALGS